MQGEDEDDTEIEEIEKDLEDLAGEVMEELAFRHPIMFDTYNICEMATNHKLQKFSIQMLQDICKFHELNITAKTSRRKQPYLDLLNSLVNSLKMNKKEITKANQNRETNKKRIILGLRTLK